MPDVSDEIIKLSLKDLMLFVPLVGSGLAVAWEVGAFLPIGLAEFSLFSISDHVVWALQAFPFALIGAMGLVLADSSTKIVDERRPQKADRSNRSVRQIFRRARLICLLGIAFAIGGGIFVHMVWPIAASLLFLYAFAKTLAPDRLIRDRKFDVSWLIIGLLVVVAAGFDMMRTGLNYSTLAEFKTLSGDKFAVLVRSGDKGLLLYQRNSGTFTFLKWDQVTSFDWSRKPIS